MIKREKFKRLLAVVFWLLATAFGLGLVATGSHAGTAYYFDPTASSSTNVGTYANPFKTLDAVNAKAFASGDDLYFKVGTTFTASDAGDYLNIDWEGTSGDRVIIGAYYGEGQFGLNGGVRPVLDGNFVAPDYYAYKGMINIPKTMDYITVTDIRVQHSRSYGTAVVGGSIPDPLNNSIIFNNLYVYRSARGQGIIFSRTQNSIVQYCTSEDNDYNAPININGASIEITANDRPDGSINNWIHHNRVIGTNEGIGIYKRASNVLVEYNVARDQFNPNYYTGEGGRNVAMRYNVAYNTSDAQRSLGYHIDVEAERLYCDGYPGKLVFYSNIAISTVYGMRVNNNLQKLGGEWLTCAWQNVAFHHNTVLYPARETYAPNQVSRGWGFNQTANNIGWEVYFKNNIVALMGNTTESTIADQYSPAGVTFSKNLIDVASTGNIGTTSIVANPNVTISTFEPLSGDLTYEELTALATPLYGNSIDVGEHLTTISATEGSANNTMPVAETAYFFGLPNVVALGADPMYIGVDADNDGDVDWVDSITSVDHDNGILTLGNSHTYTENGKVWLARSSTSAFSGSNIDVGAIEYVDYPNQRPVISQITPGSITIYPDDLTQTFSCTATDPDGDNVTVAWDFTTSGAYASNFAVAAPGALALIDPGTYPARYTITITATDEHGLSTSTSFDIQIVLDAEESSCQEWYAPSLTDDATLLVSVYNTSEFTGGIFKPASNMSVCSVDVKVRTRYGSPSGNCHLRFFTLNESNQPATVIATSNAVPFANMSAGTWVSQNAGMFTFDESVTLTSGTEYGYAWFRDTDGNLNDQPEYSDETNRTLFGIDNENDGDGVQLGQYNWTYSASLPYVVKSYDAEDDILIKVHTLQAQSESIVVNRVYAVTPNGTYKEGDSIQLAIEFNLPVALTDADEDTTKDFTGTATVGGQTFTATHSFPAFATEATTHYITGTVPASSSGLLETITLNLNGDAMGTADLTIGAGKNVGSNSEIYFDTSAPAIASFYACDEDGVQITDTTLISTVTSGYVCMESDGDSIFFADGPLGNLTLSLANIVPAVTARYLSGIGTSKLIFQWDSVAGNRGTDAAVAGTDAFDPTPTVLRDQAGNALTLTLPNTWLIDANELNFAVPKSLIYGAGWWVASDWDTEKPDPVVAGDYFVLGAGALDATETISESGITLNVVGNTTSAVTISGDNNEIWYRQGSALTITDNGTGNVVVRNCPECE